MTQREAATLEKVFEEIRTLSHKVQNIEDAILGSDYFGEGLKKQSNEHEERITKIEDKFKYAYYLIIGAGITGSYTLLDIAKRVFPGLF